MASHQTPDPLRHIARLAERYPKLANVGAEIAAAYRIISACYERGGKLLVAGNGGSAADAEHMTGELMKRFLLPRPVPPELARKLRIADPLRGAYLAENLERGLMAIPLTAHESLTTAYMNDADADGVFAQQLYGYGRAGDVLFAISTSGNSRNLLYAATLARVLEIQVVSLTGESGGELAKLSDVAIKVPERVTYKTQELHLPTYHCLCRMLEERFFGGISEESGD